jgi:import receptor subunit TOM20
MDSRTTTILTVAGVTLAASVVAYAAYFDYKRRNDIDFRKKLRKQKKKVDKSIAESKQAEASATSADSTEITAALMQEALEQIKTEQPPQTPEEKEQYFMQQVSVGEQLSTKGPDFYMPAAMSFYRALRVYPSPVELIVIYQKTIPEPIFKIIMEMTNLDVSEEPTPLDTSNIHIEHEDDETSPGSGGPPSEASSQEWDKLTDSGS